MNKQLLELRKKFRGQTAKVEGHGFDNSPLPEGNAYVGKVTRSEVKEGEWVDKVTGVKTANLQHRIMLRIEVGEHKGRTVFPYSPDLLAVDGSGITACAMNIQAILGDVIPGKKDRDGNFELKVDAFLDEVENLAHQCEGELVEFAIKNKKANAKGTHLDKDGKPRQNYYIRRGLGEDAKGVVKSAEQARVVEKIDPGASLNVTRRKKAVK